MSSELPLVQIRDRLLRDRMALLDLSTRNRLLNTPLRTRNVRTIEIVDEISTETYRRLKDGASFTFLPGRMLSEAERTELDEDDVETGGIPQPENESTNERDERGFAKRHTDLRLQTRLTSEGLQKRLFDIWYDARTLEEEQGVNILYLAFGLLRWYDADSSDLVRHAPLVLLPVSLERTSAADKFRLRSRGEPVSPNLTLQAKMREEFSLVIEDFVDEDELDLPAYIARVAETVSSQKRWEVLPDSMVLGFFSFAKFLMYRDLDPENWPEENLIDKHPFVEALLRDGFPEYPPLVASDTDKIDPVIPPSVMNHVVDADSSQAVVVAEANGGRTLVVKGPPGTGKSQTITNIIASAVASGKTVLFVAEKMAALDVVHRRLKNAGLGALALELHSNKANKRALLEELKRTKELAVPSKRDDATIISRLTDARDLLNSHADVLHTSLSPSEFTPYQLLGHLVRVRSGHGAPGFNLPGADLWSPADTHKRYEILEDLADRLRNLGNPATHVWRGVHASALDPSEIEQLTKLLSDLATNLAVAREAANWAETKLGAPSLRSLRDLSTIGRVFDAAVNCPPALHQESDRAMLRHSAWRDDPLALARLADAGRERLKARAEADAVFVEAARDADLSMVRNTFASHGHSLFRGFNGTYRAHSRLFTSYLRMPSPKRAEERIALIDLKIAADTATDNFERIRPLGAAFGVLWKDKHSDWTALVSVTDWRSAFNDVPVIFWDRLAGLNDLSAIQMLSIGFSRAAAGITKAFNAIAAQLDFNLEQAFGVTESAQIQVETLLDRLKTWLSVPDGLTRWIAFSERARQAERLDLGSLMKGMFAGTLNAETLIPSFEKAYFEVLRTHLFTKHPTLKAFDGETHDRIVASFRNLDHTRMTLAREQIAYGHAASLPREGGGVGPLGVLNAELAKKQKHLPIRVLMERASPAIQRLKPVFMMSPLSVAQFLKPGTITFDLLVMDEASQIEPVDAIGAIARVRQMIVVGDEKQLPPTRFFAKLTSGEDDATDEDDGTLSARDAESILDLCLAKGMPARMLNWHYRSHHQSLIAVSNREFYDGRLFIVPSPYDAVAGMGLKFNFLPDARYDRGNTRTNPLEAKTVAEAIIHHAREFPADSLGVATFSTAQRQAIQKQLEFLRRSNPELEAFFERHSAEPFFVKNLENIQGDERDVIFISVGYGRDSSGYMAMSFGPLNADGGHRRLNVLISRAKKRCEVFSSITGDEIDLERARSRGAAAFKMFLTFAETGKLDIARLTGRGHDSIFEEQVALRLADLGYDVKAQIGLAGFFIDLAIGDTEKPGRFVLGIECDGAQYHSARSARDRDRLRQQVLENHGWIIHRIWSTDWFLRPNEEVKKVEAAIARAKDIWRERDESGTSPPRAVPLSFTAEALDDDTDLVTGHVDGNGAAPGLAEPAQISTPYVEAEFPVNRNLELHEVPAGPLASYIVKIVEIEGPIHFDEIVTRLRILWALGRAGNRIRDAVNKGVDVAVAKELIKGGPFYYVPGRSVSIRDRSQVGSLSLRKPDVLPPAEIEAALLSIIDANFGATREELITTTARAFGFASTSAQLRSVLEAEIERFLNEGRLVEQQDLLRRGSGPVTEQLDQLPAGP